VMHRFICAGRLLGIASLAGLAIGAQLFGASVAGATVAAPTGTLIGSVTCSAGPAAYALVSIDGSSVGTHTDGSGLFRLEVPAHSQVTLDASPDALSGALASRYNIGVQPGETLDVGTLTLPACPAAAADRVADTDVPQSREGDSPATGF